MSMFHAFLTEHGFPSTRRGLVQPTGCPQGISPGSRPDVSPFPTISPLWACRCCIAQAVCAEMGTLTA